jgi:Cdc6-like AAA superfamily ATPase
VSAAVTSRRDEPQQEVCSSPSSNEAILIEGASGTGKSRLVDAFQESIISHDHQDQVFFCLEKYDEEASVDEPFQAIEECMDSLINQMLTAAADDGMSSSPSSFMHHELESATVSRAVANRAHQTYIDYIACNPRHAGHCC